MKRESRTSNVLRKSFNSNTGKLGGHTSGSIRITPKKDLREKMSEETRIRNELQTSIASLVQQRKSAQEIKQILSEDKYKKYEQYMDLWIEDKILKENPDIKNILTKALYKDRDQEEIVEEIKNANSELYSIYEEQIINKIKNEIKTREIRKKQEEEKRKKREEERKKQEEER